jgi:hypothetical protein
VDLSNPQFSDADTRVGKHADALLTCLFLFNGFRFRPWNDLRESSWPTSKDAAVEHRDKTFYVNES